MATRKTSKNKCDKLARMYALRRDSECCQVCGSLSTNVHHIVGRRNYRLRWEPDNLLVLCPKHHTFDTKFSAHQTPTIFGEWFADKYPQRNQFLKDTVNEIWDKDYDKILEVFNEL